MMAVATFVGGVAAHTSGWPLFPAVLIFSYLAGLMAALGQRFLVVGLRWAIQLVIASAIPLPPREAAVRALLVLAGGLWQGALVVVSWAFTRGNQERSSLADAYRALGEYAAAVCRRPASSDPVPPPAVFGSDAVADPNPLLRAQERYRFLLMLEQAERIRASLAAVASYGPDCTVPELVAVVLDGLADALEARRGHRERADALRKRLTAIELPRPCWRCVTMTIAYAVFAVNYLLFAVFLTDFVVTLMALLGETADQTATARLAGAGIGAILALIGYLAWPSWEGEPAQQKLARLFETQAHYAAVVLRAYVRPGQAEGAPPRSELRAAGPAARRARSDAEASADRLADEPARPPMTARLAYALTGIARRMAHTSLTLPAAVEGAHAGAHAEAHAGGRTRRRTRRRTPGRTAGPLPTLGPETQVGLARRVSAKCPGVPRPPGPSRPVGPAR